MRRISAAAGCALVAFGLVSPGDSSFPLHMTAHLALWDLGPLALLAAGRFRRPLQPVLTLALWFGVLSLWHVPGFFDAARRHELVHLGQHVSFLAVGLAMWAPVFAPRWFTAAWKLGYVFAMQLGGLVLANVLLWSRPLYAGYGQSGQRTAGGILLLEGGAVLIGAFTWVFLRASREPKAGRVQ